MTEKELTPRTPPKTAFRESRASGKFQTCEVVADVIRDNYDPVVQTASGSVRPGRIGWQWGKEGGAVPECA